MLTTRNRIKVLLTPSVAQQLKSFSSQKGVPINKLVCEWIINTKPQDVLIGNTKLEKRDIVCELRLNSNHHELLSELAYELGITISSLVWRIICNNLRLHHNPLLFSESQISTAWQRGIFTDLPEHSESQLEKLSVKSLYQLVRIYIEMGNLTEAQDAIDIFTRLHGYKSGNLEYMGLLNISKSRLARINKNLAASESYASHALEIASRLGNNHISALAFFRLGIYELGRGDTQMAWFYLEKSAAQLRLKDEPFIFLQIYAMKAIISAFSFNTQQYNLYANLAEDILLTYPNAYFQAYFNSIMLQKRYIYEEQGLLPDVEKNIALAELSGSKLMIFDAHELAGTIATTLNEESHAIGNLEKALVYERDFRGEIESSKIKLFQLINQAKHDYQSVKAKLQFIKERINQQGLVPEVNQYIFAAVDYLYSADIDLRDGAVRQFKQLQSNTELPVLKEAVQYTLSENALGHVL